MSVDDVIPYIMLVTMNLIPILFMYAIYKHRLSLESEATRMTIGSLYQTVQPTSIYSLSYSTVFLMRRSFFVLITFALFAYPALQTQIQLLTIPLYITYTQFALVYESPVARRTEFFNEGIFLLASYHMMFFTSTWLYEERTVAGWSLIILIVAMIVGNYAVITYLSINDFKYRFKMWRLKKKRDMVIKERNQALDYIRTCKTMAEGDLNEKQKLNLKTMQE